jgi:mRNA-degrading endonuclease RelE of RelBE toxin-antitoxin system
LRPRLCIGICWFASFRKRRRRPQNCEPSAEAEKRLREGITLPSISSEEKKPWFVVLTGPARKRLKRISPRDFARIYAAIEEMKEDPLHGDVRKLHGGLEGFRRRVGDWRIFFDVNPTERQVIVTDIERRTSTTY